MLASLLLSLAVGCAPEPGSAPVDADRDGVPRGRDCDDADPFVFPGASERCNGVDDDCDGVADGPDALGRETFTEDADLDGYGAVGGRTVISCDPGAGWVRQASDCDDADPLVHPGRADGCNGVDDDCDGEVDEQPDRERFRDDDGDGFGDPDRPLLACAGAGAVLDGSDCDDGDPDVHPGAIERCGGADEDCDGLVDDADPDVSDPVAWLPDADHDGHGVAGGVEVVSCAPPNDGWVTLPGDCDDREPSVHPGAVQTCRPVDDDCDGALPGDDGWWDPAWPYRIPLEVTAGAEDLDRPWVVVGVDLRAALDALGDPATFDPASLQVVVQDCAGGAVALTTAFTDGMADPLAGAPADPVGDEAGAVHARLDRSLPAGATLRLAAYFGGPPRVDAGAATATATSLATDAWSATFDADRGGMLDDLRVGGVLIASQADADQGNGLPAGASWSQVDQPGSTALVAAGPVVAAVIGEGSGGGISSRVTWWAIDGLPALFASIRWDASQDVAWGGPSGPTPMSLVLPGLGPVAPSSGPGWVAADDGAAGVALGWVVPPDAPLDLSCDLQGCRAAATEGQGNPGAALADEALIADRVLLIVPWLGAAPDDAALRGWFTPPAVAAGPAEALALP